MTEPQPIILPYKGLWPTIAASAYIAPGAAIIGDVVIGEECSVWFGCVLRGDVNRIRVGNRVNIQDGSVIHVSRFDDHGTVIGDDVSLGHRVLLHACILEPGSFVGMDATVMDDVVVESGGFVAAGSLVTPGKRVPSGELWSGRPAKFMRPVGDQERKTIVGTAINYANHAREYREEAAQRRARVG